jgi:putative chitinase
MITATILRAIAPAAKLDLDALAAAMATTLPRYGIDTPLRVAHFVAQAAQETDGFKTLEEYGGASYFRRYDGRADLGNTEPGDGARYHGRGVFQLTGRANYRSVGRSLGVDLEGNPDRAAEPALSVRIACDYWRARGINPLADADDLEGVTRKINGGLNGLADRRTYLARAKPLIVATPPKPAPLPPQRQPAVPPAQPAAQPTGFWALIVALVRAIFGRKAA